MRFGVLLTLALLAMASLVGLVGYLFDQAGDRVQGQLQNLRQGAIAAMTGGGEMTLALQTSRAAAHQLVAERYRTRFEAAHDSEWRVGADVEVEDDALEEGLDAFEERLRETREAARTALEAGAEGDPRSLREGAAEVEERLTRIETEFAVHRAMMERFIHLVRYHPSDHVHEYVHDVLEPHFRETMLPLIRAYEADAEQALAERMVAMEGALLTVRRRNLYVTGLALVAAIVLGIFLARSVSRPLAALTEAALRVGRGQFDSPIEMASGYEVSVLARAFNRMIADLQESTVSRSYLDSVIQSMADMLLVTDAGGRIRTVNRVTLRELGYREQDLLGRPLADLLAGEGATPEGGRLSSGEHLFRTGDGSTVPVLCSSALLEGESGQVEGVVHVAQNISERKRAEARLRSSLEEKEVLLKEVHHRVKNNLQIISSLLHLQSRGVADAATARMFRESQNRIRSMALIHEQLYNSRDLARIDFSEYVDRLLSHIVRSHGPVARGVRFRARIDPTPLPIDRAIPCSIIVNELVSNAIEHAFPEGRGEVVIAFERHENGHRLAVKDDGIGLPPDLDPLQAQSLGLKLVAALAQQLGGKLEFTVAGGTEFSITYREGGSDAVAGAA